MGEDDIRFVRCPECNKPMVCAGVMLMGNILTGEASHPVWRWDCPDCEVMLAEDMADQEDGWRMWLEQNPNDKRENYR